MSILCRHLLVALAITIICSPAAQACAVCFGLRDDHLNNAVNMAIFVMFGALILVLGSLIAFVVCLARRASRNPLLPTEITHP